MDKRIDVLAVALQAGMTVFDLEEVELAYAPQFGAAKDPINMAGFVASAIARGEYPQVDVDDLDLILAPGPAPFLLDVRTPKEFAAGAIPNATNIPIDELRGACPSCRATARSWSTARPACAGTSPRECCGSTASRPPTSAADIARTACFRTAERLAGCGRAL